MRVNCVVPDWIDTERVDGRASAPPPTGRRSRSPTSPTPSSPCIRDDALAGRVMVLLPGEPPRLLDGVAG